VPEQDVAVFENVWVPVSELQVAATVATLAVDMVPPPTGLTPEKYKVLPLIVPVERVPSEPIVGSSGIVVSNPTSAITVLPFWATYTR
jgi:hypothetical protein